MAKRDFFYDTKTGRTLLYGLTFLMLIVADVLVVLCFLRLLNPQKTEGRGQVIFWLVLGILMIFAAGVHFLVLNNRRLQARKENKAGETAPVTEPVSVPLPEAPDEVILVNPTRADEPDGAILVYRKEGVLVFDGQQIPIGKIVEGSVSNSNNNPYLPVAYHILLVMADKNIVHIPAGQDFEWAQEALKQLQAAIAPQE